MQGDRIGEKRKMETRPAKVKHEDVSKQAGEAKERWCWVEPSIWTNRMLETLERGVKGGVWFSLMDKVWARRNLEAAFAQVKANDGAPGVDGVTIARFERRLSEELERLQEQLRNGSYEPQSVRRARIAKSDGSERALGIPTVRDRVVQTALRNVLEPIYEVKFAEQSYGFRPKRGAKDALRRVDQLLQEGYRHIVDADIEKCFDSIDKSLLLSRIKEEVADGKVLSLLEKFLTQAVWDNVQEWIPETGTPQGAVISPLLANIYLNPLDHEMATRGIEMVRYADDFVILCKSEEDAQNALNLVDKWMNNAKLNLHRDKTQLVDMTKDENSFEFLGYRFARKKNRDYRFPRKSSIKKLRATIRPKTKRANGHSLESTIKMINPTLRAWYEYFKHSHKATFPAIDGWVRMRLRSILRKRRGGEGRGRGADHQRWQNAYFTSHGLFSLTAKHAEDIQSPLG